MPSLCANADSFQTSQSSAVAIFAGSIGYARLSISSLGSNHFCIHSTLYQHQRYLQLNYRILNAESELLNSSQIGDCDVIDKRAIDCADQSDVIATCGFEQKPR